MPYNVKPLGCDPARVKGMSERLIISHYENNYGGAVTFVGYLVAGFWGSLVSTVGIFLPSFILVLVAAPLLAKYRANPNVQGFVKGAYAAAIGTIFGACILLGRIAIGDWLTALIGIASLAVLFRWKVNNPSLIAATAVVGLIAFPLLQPDWVMVK
jgi:chromate transporter